MNGTGEDRGETSAAPDDAAPDDSAVTAHGPVAIRPLRNGPLMLKGPLEVVSATGETLLRGNEAFLCRCGASEKKPFCDGTHKRIGFTAEGGRR